MTSPAPLINPYLWAIGPTAATIASGTELAGRYRVVAPQIWLDTQPTTPPKTPAQIPKPLLPYHYLYPYRLHLPIVYGLCPLQQSVARQSGVPLGSVELDATEIDATQQDIVLLENVPLEGAGCLLPQLQTVLAQTKALRQVHWLWQLLQLWSPLEQLGVVASLFVPDNLYVEGWLIRLRELYAGSGDGFPLGATLTPLASSNHEPMLQPSLANLGQYWESWLTDLQPEIQGSIVQICQQLQTEGITLDPVKSSLNALLLSLTHEPSSRLQVFGLTDVGSVPSHNEDACYPLPDDLQTSGTLANSLLIPHVAIVCDGIGGHDGGEVASQLAIRSLKLQAQALIREISSQDTLLPPEIMIEQLAAGIRVVNNLISSQNDTQGRQARGRMGTTLVMALHLQQAIPNTDQVCHEFYLANIGNSRAYWITPNYCQQLTVDDNVSCREVRLGHQFYRESLQRPDAKSLTQALGNRSGENLYLQIQRLIFDEDGVLLLCSDGLSDNGWVERSWGESIVSVLNGTWSLKEATQTWITLANQKNGHDNVSAVLMCYRISPDYPVLVDATVSTRAEIVPITPAKALTEASAVLLAETAQTETGIEIKAQIRTPTKTTQGWRFVLTLLLTVGILGLVSLIAIRQLSPPPEPETEQSL